MRNSEFVHFAAGRDLKMKDNFVEFSERALELVKEMESYEISRAHLMQETSRVFDKYQGRHMSFADYRKSMDRLMKGRTKEEWTDYYNSYLLSVAKKLEFLNTQLFYMIYRDKEYMSLGLSGKAVPQVKPQMPKSVAEEMKEKLKEKKEELAKKVEEETKVRAELKPVPEEPQIRSKTFGSLFDALEESSPGTAPLKPEKGRDLEKAALLGIGKNFASLFDELEESEE